MLALLLSSITTTPCTVHPVRTSVKTTTKVSTVLVYTWLTLPGGTNAAPANSGLPSPQSMLYAAMVLGDAMSKVKLAPEQLNQYGALAGMPL